ncbi:MAG: fumarylacetoacetate hydrolase family protein [Deltaproteobacteria bacterium]|nr:fumarylacetoacetate hydrolase family protein [Deltaproteobacteria bacterium]
MKIAQYRDSGRTRLGLVEGAALTPSTFPGDLIDLIEQGADPVASGPSVPLERIEFAPAVTRPSKIIAIGLNYMDHVRESKGKVPEAPLVFAKFPSSLAAHGAAITWDPSITSKVDFEAELAVVMGREASRISEDEALDAVFGYTCGNDVSARDLQFGDGQWVRGKSLDTFCPLGPWVVTAEEIPDPHDLALGCRVNGRVMQESRTDQMIFRLPRLLSYLSRQFTLLPGDVILTGTPHGVGAFREPSVYLRDGDEVIVEIERIGALVNTCRTLSRSRPPRQPEQG